MVVSGKENIMDIKILVGKRVKTLRNKLGLSQEELADIVELDRTYITSVECGKRNISIVEVPYKTNDSYEYLGKYYEFRINYENKTQ